MLKSKGGHLLAGLRIGEKIHEIGLETAVSYDSICTSACALAWLGGSRRLMFETSLIGFHQAYIQKNDIVFTSAIGNALVGAYMANLGLSYNAIAFATAARPTEVNWIEYSIGSKLGIEIKLLTETDRKWIDDLDREHLH